MIRLIIISLALLLFGCNNQPGERASEEKDLGDWQLHQYVTKQVDSIEFIFPAETYAFGIRDSLVEQCLEAIEHNCALIGLEEFTYPYKIKFFPSKAAMMHELNMGVSGRADYWIKQVSLVTTDDPTIIETENIISPPIKHELMHMIVMEEWGFPPESNLWLNEGLATYAANYCNGYNVAQVYRYLLEEDMLIPRDSMVTQFYQEDEMIGYHQAAHIVQYLIEEHDVEKLKTFWQSGFESFESVYGMPYSELEAALQKDLLAKLPASPEIDWDTFSVGCK